MKDRITLIVAAVVTVLFFWQWFLLSFAKAVRYWRLDSLITQ